MTHPASAVLSAATRCPRRLYRRWRRRLGGLRTGACSWRDLLLSENLRFSMSLLLACVFWMVVPTLRLELNWVTADNARERALLLALAFVVIVSAYTALFALFTLVAAHGQPRARLLALARLPHARRHVFAYRAWASRAGARTEVINMMVTAIVAIAVLIARPQGVPVTILLIIAVGSMAATWFSTVVTYALEYAAADAVDGGFSLPGTTVSERGLPEYLYAAVLVQTSSGPTDLVPQTARARRLVRDHALLSHITSTVIIAVGVSLVISVLTTT